MAVQEESDLHVMRQPRFDGFEVPQEQWIEGIFSGTHGSYWDNDGNLYIQDWNVSGRLMKLVRVK